MEIVFLRPWVELPCRSCVLFASRPKGSHDPRNKAGMVSALIVRFAEPSTTHLEKQTSSCWGEGVDHRRISEDAICNNHAWGRPWTTWIVGTIRATITSEESHQTPRYQGVSAKVEHLIRRVVDDEVHAVHNKKTPQRGKNIKSSLNLDPHVAGRWGEPTYISFIPRSWTPRSNLSQSARDPYRGSMSR